MDRLYLVVPCFNEQEVLRETAAHLREKVMSLIGRSLVSDHSRILFVDDGSKDATWRIIEELRRQDGIYAGLKLAHNRGHQNALLAGLMTAKDRADLVISLDADLQDDVDAIDRMIEAYRQGNDIVYGVRSGRRSDTAFKRGTAQGFYKLMKALGVDIVYNHADYRLMSRRALEGLAGYREVNLFLRGIVPLIGFPSATIEYERRERFAGESKYPLKKMLAFAFDGITSFSVRPIRLVTTIGACIFFVSLLMMLWFLIAKLLGHTVPGWSTLMGSIWLIGGLQLFCLGIIGEYIGKIYQEVKNRPRYLIETDLDDPAEK